MGVTALLMGAESTLENLFAMGENTWSQQGDIVCPFIDPQCRYIETVWTFDLDADVLRFEERCFNLSLPLNLIRQRRVSLSDFEPY